MNQTWSGQTNGRRVRIVHVASQLAVGGMEKLLLEFARHANCRDFCLHFVCLGMAGPVAQELKACGWPMTLLQEPGGLRPGLVLRLAAHFRRWGVDVVHTHNTRPLIYAGPAARLARVPGLLHTRHGQRFGAGRRENVVFRLVAGLADWVVCVSEDSARLSAAEGLSMARVRTVHNGIDLSRFAYSGPCASGPAVMLGRLSPEKDVGTLLQAVAIVRREDASFRLEVAGDGPCAGELRRLADELSLADGVRFLGEIRDVPALLARASLFVLPSLTEGISLTLLEAMARGLPVVATRVGGNAEVVADGQTGWLVPPGSPTDLAAALVRLGRDPAMARRMALAGRERVEAHFDARRMVAEYERLYARLARRAPLRGAS